MVAAPRHPIELPALGVVLVRPGGCVALTPDGDQAFDLPWRSMPLGFHAFQGETLQPRAGLALPPVQSGATAMIAARHVHQLASWSDRPIVVENARSIRAPGPGELSDGAFLARVALAANCPIALDLEAVAADGADAASAVLALAAQLPRSRVAAVRLRLDSLAQRMSLMHRLVPSLPFLKAILLDTPGDAPGPDSATRDVLAALWASRAAAVDPHFDTAPNEPGAPAGSASGHPGPAAYPTEPRQATLPPRVGRRQRSPLLFLAHG